MRQEHGPSKSEPRHRRQQERSIPTLSVDLSKQRLSIIRTLIGVEAMQEQEEKGLVRWKEKITLSGRRCYLIPFQRIRNF